MNLSRRLSGNARHLSGNLRRSPPGVGGIEPLFDALKDREPKRPSRTLEIRNRERPHRLTPRALADTLSEEFKNATESEMIVDSEIAAAKVRAKAKAAALQRERLRIKDKWDEGNASWGE